MAPATLIARDKSEPAAASWRALGCDVRLLVTDPAALPRARDLLTADLAALDLAASRFRADSEVSRIAAAGGQTVPISPVLADAIWAALAGAELSDGDLDPTLGSALARLGYDRTFSQLAASAEGVTATASGTLSVRPTADWRDVELDPAAGTVKVPAGVTLDLGATAKARCADLAAAEIARACGCGVLVSLGGDIAVAGPAPADGWVVRVQDVTGDPDEEVGGQSCLVSITSGGLATSSTTARRWRHGGSVLHHILDPRTGQPAADVWRTVSVAAPTALLANIASTTAVIRAGAAGSWLAQLGLPARLVPQVAPATSQTSTFKDPQPQILRIGGWPSAGEASPWTL